MNVFEKLKDYRKIDFNIYVEDGMITHIAEDGYNEYTITSDRIEFAKVKGKFNPTFKSDEISNMNINIYINNYDGSKSLEVITSPHILSLNVKSIREMAPIYTLGNTSPSTFSRRHRAHVITLKTAVNISASRQLLKINTNSLRINASDLSHSIIGTPFVTLSDNRVFSINSTGMRGVLSYE